MKKMLDLRNKYIFFYLTVFLICLCLFSSCKKFLDAKPDKSLVTPQTAQDLQGMLDYFPFMNKQCSDMSACAADDYYLTENVYESFPDNMKAAYTWQPEMFDPSPDWQNEYTVVYYANVVLDNIDRISKDVKNQSAWNNCKGSALVFRAKAFYEIAQIWTKAYDSATASKDLGIPLRLTSDFNVNSKRSSLSETYSRIISDLETAIPMLPDLPSMVYRPSKCAAYGLLARTYLTMNKYKIAALYADSCLQINNRLLDYNTLNLNSKYAFPPITEKNPEDIFHSTTQWFRYNLYYSYTNIDTGLIKLYVNNDIRKAAFFIRRDDGSYYFRGSYDGTIANFNGIATDEVYLIKAECLAREGKISAAMDVLNTLLETRWEEGTFVPYTATNDKEALKSILMERRKELVFRMLRFSDVKRLNNMGSNITLKRVVAGTTYTLPPNDPRYALPIPLNVIQLASLKQN